ncbi:hypothetical protein FQN52_000771 [Onygenales sp. PD_12]|nr:hypothetical protein FQN52_000771 [Onygenales sp. PD_12]KAK2802175.1 hypothetical protein FQN51_004856 [Onygenales sp. PD_10]
MPLLWQDSQLIYGGVEDDFQQYYPNDMMASTTETHLRNLSSPDHSRETAIQPSSISPPFQINAEPPQFAVRYRWWEDEARTILMGFCVGDIKRLVRFHLYHDDNLPREILRRRNTDAVTGFLSSFLPLGDIHHLTHHDKVEKLLSRCQSNHYQPKSCDWFPVSPSIGLDMMSLVTSIDKESCQQFRIVPFEDWVHYSLGYPTPSVQWFFIQHSKLSSLLSDHLETFPNLAAEYVEIEKKLRLGNPFVHQALLQSLQTRRIIQPSPPASAHKLLSFLIIPLQNLFQNRGIIDLAAMLKKLTVLGIRFVRKYHRESDVDWIGPFDAESPLLDEVIASTSPKALAKSLTYSDSKDFTGLSLQSIAGEDHQFRSLTRNWDSLCTVVEECALAHPRCLGYLKDCVKVLYELRNYYSATALLHGIQKANPNPFDLLLPSAGAPLQNADESLLFIFDLLDSTDNYASYRNIMQDKPGLPFLTPHAREYQMHGEQELVDLFPLPDL